MYATESRFELSESDPSYMEPPYDWAIENWRKEVVFQIYPEKIWNDYPDWCIENELDWVFENRKVEAWKEWQDEIIEVEDGSLEDIQEMWGE